MGVLYSAKRCLRGNEMSVPSDGEGLTEIIRNESETIKNDITDPENGVSFDKNNNEVRIKEQDGSGK